MMADAFVHCKDCSGNTSQELCAKERRCYLKPIASKVVIDYGEGGGVTEADWESVASKPEDSPKHTGESGEGNERATQGADDKCSDAQNDGAGKSGNWDEVGIEWEDPPASQKTIEAKARSELWVSFAKRINDLPAGSTLTEIRSIIEAAWKAGFRRPDELGTLRGIILARKHNLIGVTANALDSTFGDIAASEKNALRAVGDDWRLLLDRTKDGVPISNERSAGIAIKGLYGNNLYYDTFSGQIWSTDTSGNEQPLKNVNYVEVVVSVQEAGYPQVKKSHVADALDLITRQHQKSRLAEQLNSFAWNATERADTWLQTYCGVEDTRYYRMCGRFILLQAVARAFKPGSKCDLMPILIGDQGVQKSTTWRVLSLDHYLEFDQNFMTRDGMMQMLGKWFVDWSELVAFSKREATEAKGFISRQTDKFRMPYDRIDEEHPRQFVLVGTSNSEPFLKDMTGSRRNLCLEATRINVQALQSDVEQLWAEAVAMYRHGLLWHPRPLGAGDDWFYDAQLKSNKKWQIAGADPWFAALEHFIWYDYRVTENGRVELIGERLEPRSVTPGAEWLLEHVCKVPTDRQDQRGLNRVKEVMTMLGYEPSRRRDLQDGQGGSGAPKTAYVRIGS